MATLYYKIQITGPTYADPPSSEKLFIAGKEVGSKYDVHWDSTGTCYFTKSVVSATFEKPSDYDTATAEIDHTGIDHDPVRLWHTTYVDDSFVIPPELTPDNLPGIFERTDDGFGFGVKNLGLDFSSSVSVNLVEDGIWATVEKYGPSLGLTNISTALKNASIVKAVLGTTLQNGLDVFETGLKMLSDPNATAAQYDALSNGYLTNTQGNVIQALQDVTTFTNPAQEEVFDALVGSVSMMMTLDDSQVPIGGSASVGLEINLHDLVTINAEVTGTAHADIILAGDSGVMVDSGGGNDLVIGGAGSDNLSGGIGGDRLYGGDGNDGLSFSLWDAAWSGDRDYLNGGSGRDVLMMDGTYSETIEVNLQSRTIFSTDSSAVLAQFTSIESFLLFTDSITLKGSGSADFVEVLGENAWIDAGGGNDTVRGSSGWFSGGTGTDHFTFNSSTLERSSLDLATGNFTIGAQSGTVQLTAFESFGSLGGNVDWLGTTKADTIKLEGGETVDGRAGVDTVVIYGSLNLTTGKGADYFKKIEFTVKNVENVTGSVYADRLIGNSLVNRLISGSGNDALDGAGGSDYLSGDAGNDIIDGGADADTMNGGTGNDVFYVDNIADAIVEAKGGGNDTIAAKTSYVLGSTVEAELLRTSSNAGTSAINLTGNTLAQTIIGNAGNNVLHDGGVGASDILQGLGGNDTYRVFNAANKIIEASSQGAADLVMAAVDYALTAGAYIERLATNGTAGTAAIDLTGNELAQEVVGNAGSNILKGMGGNDVLKGLAGHDTLAGGTGKDTFMFNTALSATTNVDKITDFSVVDDTITLDNMVFTALTATGALSSAAFRANDTGLAGDSTDRIIYEKDTGELYYDANGTGSGGGILFAKIGVGLSLTSADFLVS